MSLLGFHRVLIFTGIVFCAAFAWFEAARAARGSGSALLAGVFFLFAVGLAVYLIRMRAWLGYGESRSEPES